MGSRRSDADKLDPKERVFTFYLAALRLPVDVPAGRPHLVCMISNRMRWRCAGRMAKNWTPKVSPCTHRTTAWSTRTGQGWSVSASESCGSSPTATLIADSALQPVAERSRIRPSPSISWTEKKRRPLTLARRALRPSFMAPLLRSSRPQGRAYPLPFGRIPFRSNTPNQCVSTTGSPAAGRKARPSVGRCQGRRLTRGMQDLTDCVEQRSQGEWLGKKGEMGFVGESPAHHRAF